VGHYSIIFVEKKLGRGYSVETGEVVWENKIR
jgi:hypothetical protein